MDDYNRRWLGHELGSGKRLTAAERDGILARVEQAQR